MCEEIQGWWPIDPLVGSGPALPNHMLSPTDPFTRGVSSCALPFLETFAHFSVPFHPKIVTDAIVQSKTNWSVDLPSLTYPSHDKFYSFCSGSLHSQDLYIHLISEIQNEKHNYSNVSIWLVTGVCKSICLSCCVAVVKDKEKPWYVDGCPFGCVTLTSNLLQKETEDEKIGSKWEKSSKELDIVEMVA